MTNFRTSTSRPRQEADHQGFARRFIVPGRGGLFRAGGRRGHAGPVVRRRHAAQASARSSRAGKNGCRRRTRPTSAKIWAGRSVAYYSTIVFVVRKGNPKQIRDWPDLVQPGVQGDHAQPQDVGQRPAELPGRVGGGAARGGSEEDARDFVTQALSQRAGARLRRTWLDDDLRPEQHRRRPPGLGKRGPSGSGRVSRQAGDLIYPSCSIRAEPPVAVVDANVDRKGTRAAAEAYLEFLFTRQAQEIVARHSIGRWIKRCSSDFHHTYHPGETNPRRSRSTFSDTTQLFPVTELGRDWDEGSRRNSSRPAESSIASISR